MVICIKTIKTERKLVKLVNCENHKINKLKKITQKPFLGYTLKIPDLTDSSCKRKHG